MMTVFIINRRRIITAALFTALLSSCAGNDEASSKKASAEMAKGKTVAGAMMRAGEASRRRGDISAAIEFFRRAHQAEPKQIEPLVGLGESLVAASLVKDAADAFRRALVIDPDNARALRGLGNSLIAQDQLDLAVEKFQKAVAADPKDYRAYSGLGVAHDSMADHAKAQEFYYAGLEIAPDDVNLRNNLGLSLAFAGHYNGAVEILRPLALRPGATARDRQNLALAYGLSGDIKNAENFARMDMDSRGVERNMSYYAALRSMSDPVLRVRSVRAGYALRSR